MDRKITAGVLIVFFFLTVPAYTKEKWQPPPKPLKVDEIVAKMKVQLELTDQQADEVRPIIADYLAQEEQVKLEEKKRLSKVLTGEQMYTWNFLQNEPSREKKKHL